MSPSSERGTPHYQADFPPEELSARRRRVAAEIGDGAVAVLRGAPATGAFDLFRQTNELYYLSGVEVPHAYLLLRGGSGEATLYLPPHDARHERSEGAVLNAGYAEEAAALTGIERVRPLSALGEDLAGCRALYVPHSPAETRQACRDTLRFRDHLAEADPWEAKPDADGRFRQLLRQQCPDAELRDLSPILDRHRLLKSERELALMRRAGELTAWAVVEAMRGTRAGLREFHLAAAADYLYLLHGARGGGYRPIVASGANIWNAHYYRNGDELREGELVLIDYAPDYGYYTSDIGRMWPVSGRYSPVQRELYGFVVRYHQSLLRLLRPGVTPEQVLQEAAAEMAPVIAPTGFSKPEYRRAAERMLEFPGHLSHPVGMAVHDVGSYFGRPMEPGLVFALDPQMWVPEEELYVRVEDTVAVTATGVEVLTRAAPLELDEVERVMREPGLLDHYPPNWPVSAGSSHSA
ncbi:MAG: aminopeptidase P N-terminal domain-containing protein [Armatimonadota bacterium]